MLIICFFLILFHCNSFLTSDNDLVVKWNFVLSILMQSVATFFNHVMSAIGGNTAGPGLLNTSIIIYFIIICSIHLISTA